MEPCPLCDREEVTFVGHHESLLGSLQPDGTIKFLGGQTKWRCPHCDHVLEVTTHLDERR